MDTIAIRELRNLTRTRLQQGPITITSDGIPIAEIRPLKAYGPVMDAAIEAAPAKFARTQVVEGAPVEDAGARYEMIRVGNRRVRRRIPDDPVVREFGGLSKKDQASGTSRKR